MAVPRLLIGFTGLVVLSALVAWIYPRQKVRGMVAAAEEFARAGDIGNATDLLGSVLRLRPDDERAIRLAVVIGKATSPEAELHWRTVLAKIAPSDLSNLRDLIRIALLRQDRVWAAWGLDRLPQEARSGAFYWNASASLRALAGDVAAAIAAARRASEADPSSIPLRLNLARLCMFSHDESVAQEGEKLLEAVGPELTTSLEILRIRRDRAMRLADWQQAAVISSAAIADAKSDFTDALHHIDILEAAAAEEAGVFLEKLKVRAAAALSEFSSLANWFDRRQRHAELLEWIRGISHPTRTAFPVRVAAAHAAAAVSDWQALLAETEQAWASSDFMRRALRARALRATNPLAMAWKSEWSAASLAVSASAFDSVALARNVSRWAGWQDEAGDLFAKIATRHPDWEFWALRAWDGMARRLQYTKGLYAAAALCAQLKPGDPRAENNRIYYALLLGNQPSAVTDAARLAAAHPDEKVIRATYGVARLVSGDFAAAEEALREAAGDPQYPSAGAARAAALARLGRTQEARDLAASLPLPPLLPEERAWIAPLLTP